MIFVVESLIPRPVNLSAEISDLKYFLERKIKVTANSLPIGLNTNSS